MPVANVNEKLIELFNSFYEASQFKARSELLAKAKMCVLNEMSDEEIVGFFAKDGNLESLFVLDCWTPAQRDEDEENAKPAGDKYFEQYDIVDKLLACFKRHEQLFHGFRAQLFYLIEQDRDERVKRMTLERLIKLCNEFYKSVHDLAGRDEIEAQLSELLPVLVKQMTKTSVTYSQLLSKYLNHLTNAKRAGSFSEMPNPRAKPLYTLEAFEKNENLVNEFKAVLSGQRDRVISLRAFEIVVELASISEQHLNVICENKFALGSLIDEHVFGQRASNDILSQLNCIEFLIDFARTEHGYRYFQSHGYLANLIGYLNEADADTNPFASLLVPTVVKLFSNIARTRPQEIHQQFPQYFEYLFKSATDEDLINNQLTINLAMETLIYLFESNLFKKFLFEHYKPRFAALLSRLVWLVKNSVNDKLKANVFVCFSYIICADPDLLNSEHASSKLSESLVVSSTWSQLAEELYKMAVADVTHERLFNIFLGFAKKPFVDLRLASHYYFKALGQTHFGLEYLFTPNKFNGRLEFIDGYLLNRSTELEKDGIESKFEMVKLLVTSLALNSDLAARLVAEPVLGKLQEYVRQGPYFATAQSRVAFESS